MKYITVLLFSILTLASYGQDKYNYVAYNKLKELTGTPYMIATLENKGKDAPLTSQYLLFINTLNGQSKQVDFPKGAWLRSIDHIKIDSLQINKVVIEAQTVDLDNNKKIGSGDPMQIIVLSTDGQEKTPLTPDDFFVDTWAVYKHTGSVVVAGYIDSNKNGKYDKTDKHEILLYDLKTLKLISKI